MMPWYSLALFVWILCSWTTGEAVTADPGDAAVMKSFAKNLGVSSWSGDPCSWDNFNCDTSGRVTGINIMGRGYSGPLPADFNKLTHLSQLSLQKNKLSGPLPTFSGLSNLKSAYLGDNSFASLPSDFFDGLSSLQIFSIENNENLEPWTLPPGLKDAAVLQQFYANNASIRGSIPDFLGNGSMPSLQQLELAYNNLTGTIPASFNASGIMSLHLNNQNGRLLGGRIDVFGRMQSLTEVYLQVNSFTGPIPEFVSPALSDLQLRDNELTGPVPVSLTKMPSLLNVNLTNNELQGAFPSFRSGVNVQADENNFCTQTPGKACDPRVQALLDFAGGFGYPAELSSVWTGNDPCNGWSFVSCIGGNVTIINLVNRGLVGTISPALASLTSLTQIILTGNRITGSIPLELTKLPKLTKLDLRNNNMYGTVPAFPATVQVLTEGNPNIGKAAPPPTESPGTGNPTGSIPSGTDGAPNSSGPQGGGNGSSESKDGHRVATIVGVTVACLLLLGVVIGACYYFLCRRRRVVDRVQSPSSVVLTVPSRPDNDGSVSGRELLKISIEPAGGSGSSSNTSDRHLEGGSMVISIQVLCEVTDNFSQQNVLGRGGFGVVYRGELHDGTKIAVKRMESVAVSSKGVREFEAEIAVLTKVRHRHLVSLLGYCVDGNERLLVYEYVPQGPLSSHLFEWRQAGLRPLDWKQRLTVALDVARGVEYLHGLAHMSFIHRDLKPSNILLGDDMRAKVSDFGLVKLAPEGKNNSVETKLAGTFGYLAPEYAVTGRVTTKVDVFSFGVILMELITGRRALDENEPEESMHLVTWFRRIMGNRESIMKYVDPMLQEEGGDNTQSIVKVAELAGHCTAREPSQRPDIGHAVNVLAPLVEQWKPRDADAEDCYGIDLDLPLPQALKRWQEFDGDDEDDDEGRHRFTTSVDYTHTSIPNKPSGFADSFTSADCR